MHQNLASAVRPLTAFPRFMPFPISAFTSGPFPLPFPLSFPLSFPVHFRFHFRFHFHVFRSISAFISALFISGPFLVHCCFHVRFRFHFQNRFHFRSISGSSPLPFPLSFPAHFCFHFRSCPLSFSVHFRRSQRISPFICPFPENFRSISGSLPILAKSAKRPIPHPYQRLKPNRNAVGNYASS